MDKKESFASLTGGICSLLMISVLLTIAALELTKVFESPQRFSQRLETSYMSSYSNPTAFSVSTHDFIPAIQIIDSTGVQTNVTQYLVPYFSIGRQTTDPTTGAISIETELFQTKLCTDLYQDADESLLSQFSPLKSGFSSYAWYCADSATVEVMNDPRANPDGTASSFVVNYCDTAAANLDYTDPKCETDHTVVDSMAMNIVINTKTVSRYFNPNSYHDEGDAMGYTQALKKSGTVSLIANQVTVMDFKVHRTANYLKSSKLINLPSQQQEILTYSSRYDQTNYIQSSDTQSNGIFQVSYSQDPELSTVYYASEYTLLGAIAFIGGTGSLYYCLLLLALSSYAQFRYESHLSTQIYTERPPQSQSQQQSQDGASHNSNPPRDKDEMTAAIMNRKELPQIGFCRAVADSFVLRCCNCCCCRQKSCYRDSQLRRRQRQYIKGKLDREIDLIQILKQLRIFQFLTTSLMRRNQTELVEYSAQYNLALQQRAKPKGSTTPTSAGATTPVSDFTFLSDSVRTVPQLLKGFEPRTNVYDRALLFALAGSEIDSCMQFWLEINGQLFTQSGDDDFDQENSDEGELQVSMRNFDRYLSAVPEDFDISMFDEKRLEQILLLPNGRKFSLGADQSLLANSIDFRLLNKSGIGGLRTSLRFSKKELQRPQTSALTPLISPIELNHGNDASRLFLSPDKVDEESNEVDSLLLQPETPPINGESLDRTD